MTLKFQFYSSKLNVEFIQARDVSIQHEFIGNITREIEQNVKSFWFCEWDNPPSPAETSDAEENRPNSM